MDYGLPSADRAAPSERDAERLLHRALDLGVTFIDTARIYGRSEEVIGRALAGRRREYVLATKVALAAGEESGPAMRAKIDASLAASLAALRTDVLDVVMLHSASLESLRRGEALGALDEMRRAGRLRFVGASTYGEDAALAAIDDPRCDCVQIAYNLLDRSLESRVLPRAQEKDVAVMIRSVLLKGVLTHRAATLPDSLGALKAAAAAMLAIAEEAGSDLPSLAYRFVLAHPAVSTALVGTAHEAELEAALRFVDRAPLDEALLARLRAIRVDDPAQLNPSTWGF